MACEDFQWFQSIYRRYEGPEKLKEDDQAKVEGLAKDEVMEDVSGTIQYRLWYRLQYRGKCEDSC